MISKSLLLLLFTSCLFSFTAKAQQDSLPKENWEVYMARYEKGAGSVLLNMLLKKTAPVKKLPFLLTTGVRFTDCGVDGFPNKREFTNLYKISDSVKAEVDKAVTNTLAGTFTYQCDRQDYFYISDTTGIRQKLEALYKKRFPSYLPFISIKVDKYWDSYLKFLYPNDETYEFMENQKILMALQNGGDKLDKARMVDHWAYFKTDADRNCFLTYLVKNKFKIIEKEKSTDPSMPLKIHFARTDYVKLADISRLTLELRRQAFKCNGEYDGWETFLIK